LKSGNKEWQEAYEFNDAAFVSVRLSSCNNTRTTEWILTKFGFEKFYSNIWIKIVIKILRLKLDKNKKGYMKK
jgi:hypothetical protein